MVCLFRFYRSALGQRKRQAPSIQILIDQSNSKNEISWNFEKFLVDSSGRFVARFRSGDSPLGDKIVTSIAKQ